jgi:hypothetical protein
VEPFTDDELRVLIMVLSSWDGYDTILRESASDEDYSLSQDIRRRLEDRRAASR